jgi:iron(III) transport system substrate-binding protein
MFVLPTLAFIRDPRPFRIVVVLILTTILLVKFAKAEITTYEGPDRIQQLVAGAQKEGFLRFYTSMAEKDTNRLVSAFEKQYGVKVQVWRSGKDKVLQRTIAEAKAGRNEVDFVLNPSPEMEALHKEHLLQRVVSPVQKDLIAAALPVHREWTGMRVYVYAQSYNTQSVAKEELPKTFQDLLDPKWRGRLGIEVKQQEWFYTLVQAMGEEKGLKFFRDLIATQAVSLRTGNSSLNGMVISGEVPLAMNVYTYLPEQAKSEGAHIDYITLSPCIAYTDGIAITKKAPHLYAATLFYDFLLTKGQIIVAENKAISTNLRDEATLAKFNPVFMDAAKVLESDEKWIKIFKDTLQNKATKSP